MLNRIDYEEAKALIEKASALNPIATQDFRRFSILAQQAICAANEQKVSIAMELKTECLAMQKAMQLSDSLGVIDAHVDMLHKIVSSEV